jgi:uncharacterized protein YlxW (UPF0749 family)
MSDTNGNSKWTMWAIGIMFSVMVVSFQVHASTPHATAVSKERFQVLYDEIIRLREITEDLRDKVSRMDERLKNKR